MYICTSFVRKINRMTSYNIWTRTTLLNKMSCVSWWWSTIAKKKKKTIPKELFTIRKFLTSICGTTRRVNTRIIWLYENSQWFLFLIKICRALYSPNWRLFVLNFIWKPICINWRHIICETVNATKPPYTQQYSNRAVSSFDLNYIIECSNRCTILVEYTIYCKK